jgi:hypothetical protein
LGIGVLLCYYHFNGKQVTTILSREWDLDIHDAYLPHSRDRVFSRPWFQDYMIGYLAYLVKQFIGLGYDGTVKICCINNYSALDYHQKKAAQRSCGAQSLIQRVT